MRHDGLPLEERYDTNPKMVAQAREKIENSFEGDGTIPSVRDLMALRLAENRPWPCGDVVILLFDIQEGRPEHGALRSDDHVGRIEALLPNECPECGHDYSMYVYVAHHHIAGSRRKWCRGCDHTYYEESWG